MTRKIAVLSGKDRSRVFGDFPYRSTGGGRIQIDQGWVAQNIVPATLQRANGRGKDIVTWCHRLAKTPLEKAFAEIAEHDLWKLIHTFDGLWVPRHMTWNARRPLSSHSWGIAFDLNAATNPYGGGISMENRALNSVFNKYGFAWGGDWSGAKDGMHWELADIDAWKDESQKEPRLILAIDRGETLSYHAVPDATLQEGHFLVDGRGVATLLGFSSSPIQSSTQQPIETLLRQLKVKILKRGDHLPDKDDPRYYLFLEIA